MRQGACNNAEAVRAAVRRNRVQFCYAENWIYAPPIEKMRRLIAASKEIEDFVWAIRDGREPRSGIDLAVECVNVIYAAYQSAETGCRVTLT